MTVAFSLLATRRWAGVGVALVVEVVALAALGQLSPSEIVGLPGVIAAAIAGTVAVVFGALDGAVVALAGATAFGFAIGWDAGAVAGLVVWPAVVAVVGLFARRVAGRRAALQHVVTAQERERERVAVELNEQVAQSLSGALMALRAAGAAQSEPMLAHARDLIQHSIRELRSLAVDLRPKTLDDYGVGAALDGLAASVSERSGNRGRASTTTASGASRRSSSWPCTGSSRRRSARPRTTAPSASTCASAAAPPA